MKMKIRQFAALAISLLMLLSFTPLSVNANEGLAALAAMSDIVDRLDTAAIFKTNDVSPTWDASLATKITLNDTSIAVNGAGAAAEGNVVTITGGGSYIISGKLRDGQIVINDETKTLKIQIVLNGVDINCSNGPAILVNKADKTYITVAEGTVNTLTDGNLRVNADLDAVVFSKDDMTVNGAGTLNISASYKVGIHSENDLKVCSTTLNVESNTSANSGHALRGEDLFAAKDAKITLNAGNDGIQADNAEAERGNIVLEGSRLDITAAGDGIQAEHAIQVTGGDIDISAADGDGFKAVDSIYVDGSPDIKMNVGGDGFKSEFVYDPALLIEGGNIQIMNGKFDIEAAKDGIQASSATADDTEANASIQIRGGSFDINATGGDGIKATKSIEIEDGNYTINAKKDALHCEKTGDATVGSVIINNGVFNLTSVCDGIQAEALLAISGGTFTIKTTGTPQDATSTASGVSCKGLKAAVSISVTGGTYDINTTDDAIHSNDMLSISCDSMDIITNDDGIHADDAVTINGGDITISRCYEGIEASLITLNGGNIRITASDDGVNAAGGVDGSSMGRAGENPFDPTAAAEGININGGYLYIDSKGDGVDSNGALKVSGGITIVNGPTSNGDGALDYDGSATITGGVFIAVGSSGMAQNFNTSSLQCSIMIKFNAVKAANSTIALFDASGSPIAAFAPAKQMGSILISVTGMAANKAYEFKTGGSINGAKDGFAQGTDCYNGGTTLCSTTPTSNSWVINESGAQMGGGTGGSGGRPQRPPVSAPPAPPALNYTLGQVTDIMDKINTEYKTNGVLPESVSGAFGETITMASYLRLACIAVTNIEAKNTTATINYLFCNEPAGYNNTFYYDAISKKGYLDAASRILDYIGEGSLPPNNLPFPGQNNINEYTGNLSYELATLVLVRVMAYYKANNLLPESVDSTAVNITPTPMPKTTPNPTPTQTVTATPTISPSPTASSTSTFTPAPTPTLGSKLIVPDKESGYSVDRESGMLYNVSEKTSIAQLNANLNVSVRVFDKNGVEITDQKAFVCTGSKIKFIDGDNVADELTLSVLGDLNGDGIANSRDIASLQRRILEAAENKIDAVFLAADMTGDGKINSRDIATLQRKILAG